jgi:hypothetical protein
LLREGEGIAAQVLRNFDVDLEQLRVSILKELDPNLIPENILQAPVKPNSFSVKIKDWSGRNFGEEFSPQVVQALAFSHEEAERLHQNAIGTDHLLLGIIKLEQGEAVNLLKSLGLDFDTIRAEVEKRTRPVSDEKRSGAIPYTPRTKRVLEMAKEEAKTMKRTYLGIEHLSLGLLRESEGTAAEIFKHLEVDVAVARKKILAELDPLSN